VRSQRKSRPGYNNGTPSQHLIDKSATYYYDGLQAAAMASTTKILSNHSEWLDSPIETSRNAFWLTVSWRHPADVSFPALVSRRHTLSLLNQIKRPKNGDLIVAQTDRLQRSYL